ncbi:MAG: DUF4298 domain-containing protein [Solobacterium sp.]|nr:DUF4298 domain-containing protein [Solobacterium sp.]
MTKQTDRITEMEQYLDSSIEAAEKLQEAMEIYEDNLENYLKLTDYYGSTLWRKDLDADAAGNLPADLKRGVLSEDAVYDLITATRELRVQMVKILSLISEWEKKD